MKLTPIVIELVLTVQTIFSPRDRRLWILNCIKKINELANIDYRGRISPNLSSEPILHPELRELMAYARRVRNARLILYTNGDFLDRKKFDDLRDAGNGLHLFNRGIPGLVPPERRTIPNPCFVADYELTVLVNGDIAQCGNDFRGEHVFGNARERSIIDI